MKYYLDANVILDLMNNHPNVLETFKKVYTTDTIRIPDIAYYEVMRGFKYKANKLVEIRMGCYGTDTTTAGGTICRILG